MNTLFDILFWCLPLASALCAILVLALPSGGRRPAPPPNRRRLPADLDLQRWLKHPPAP